MDAAVPVQVHVNQGDELEDLRKLVLEQQAKIEEMLKEGDSKSRLESSRLDNLDPGLASETINFEIFVVAFICCIVSYWVTEPRACDAAC